MGIHIATVFKYLTYDRYQKDILFPGEHLMKIFLKRSAEQSPGRPAHVKV